MLWVQAIGKHRSNQHTYKLQGRVGRVFQPCELSTFIRLNVSDRIGTPACQSIGLDVCQWDGRVLYTTPVRAYIGFRKPVIRWMLIEMRVVESVKG